jgi:hypothetical protein
MAVAGLIAGHQDPARLGGRDRTARSYTGRRGMDPGAVYAPKRIAVAQAPPLALFVDVRSQRRGPETPQGRCPWAVAGSIAQALPLFHALRQRPDRRGISVTIPGRFYGSGARHRAEHLEATRNTPARAPLKPFPAAMNSGRAPTSRKARRGMQPDALLCAPRETQPR